MSEPRSSTGPGPGRSGADGSPLLSAAELARLEPYGVVQDVRAGDVVYRPGDPSYDLVVILAGRVQILAPANRDEPEAAVAAYGPGGFLGELNLLTGQTVYLVARVVEAGTIQRIAPAQFRRLMAEDPGISDVMIRTFLARRDLLRESSAAHLIEIIGHEASAGSLALRTYAARQRLPHVWLEADSPAGRAVMAATRLGASELPTVVTLDRVLRIATPAQLDEGLGLTYRAVEGAVADLTVVGSGPAGLAAAVYGASEGLSTLLLDAVGTGGQAAASSRIENYLGFPSGISGSDLTQRATLQALKFGARLFSPCRAVGLDASGPHLTVVLAGGSRIDTRSVIIATGARYRSLPLARWADFEGAGIYYAATALEARACRSAPVVVVGGANSAGQAALYLASLGSRTSLVVRGPEVRREMSAYLVDRLQADPRVTVLTSTEVTGLGGDATLRAVTLTDRANGESTVSECRGLFCFIGAEPATGWDHGVDLDPDGFVRTDAQLDPGWRTEGVWAALGRAPLSFETSSPGVFAVGDVRSGSLKRVTAAVGEGAGAVRSVHAAVGLRT